ncbi:MAG: O-antigen ligase family protein [Elusimicrobia bacterium]|nr:O-antigen ligase family protein [Elusimicrobiota bacterium]
MLALLIGLLVALGPLLRGGWDLWSQSLLFLAVAAGFSCWLVGRLLVGYLPLPSKRMLAWAGALAVLSAASALMSPVSAYAVPSWRALALGLWIFPALETVSKDERAAVDQAIRAAAWVLVLLAFYQHFHDRMSRPPATFLNQNVFAGTILMLLPLALQKNDWLLCAGLLAALMWAHSVGAWLGLGGALILARRGAGPIASRLGAGIGLVCLVLIYGKLQDPEVIHRWHWWTAAWRMLSERPWLGFGPGSFAYVMPSFQQPGRDLSSLYAHQYFLETGAESGLPYLVLFTAGVLHLLHRGGEHKRFGAAALLIQSCWDYALSIPANFWLFCYFAASSGSQSSRGVNISPGRKLPYSALVLALSYSVCSWASSRWRADRIKSEAAERFRSGAPAVAVLPDLERSAALAPDPEAERDIAELALQNRDFAEAARHLERAAVLNPFRASTWAALERVDLQLGRAEAARRARAQGALYCPALRLP